MIWLQAVSDLFVNLSAGWFGAAVIFPLNARRGKIRRVALILNIFFGIFALVIAVAKGAQYEQKRRLGRKGS